MAMEAPPCELARARRPGVVARAQEDAPPAAAQRPAARAARARPLRGEDVHAALEPLAHALQPLHVAPEHALRVLEARRHFLIGAKLREQNHTNFF